VYVYLTMHIVQFVYIVYLLQVCEGCTDYYSTSLIPGINIQALNMEIMKMMMVMYLILLKGKLHIRSLCPHGMQCLAIRFWEILIGDS
jgi:hypothetical protein